MEQEAINFIKAIESKELYVAFSGGKDSIVILDLVKKSGKKFSAYYACTRIDPPEVYSFIRKNYPEVKFLYGKINFWEGIRKHGIPMITRRWCCNVLKKDPTKKKFR